MPLVTILSLWVLGIVVLCALSSFRRPALDVKGRSPDWPLDFYELRCERLAERIADGDLAVEASGLVRLPAEDGGLSADGKVYVTRRPDGNLLVLFVSWRDPGGYGGFLYCREPLEREDAGRDPKGNFFLEIVGPARDGRGTERRRAMLQLDLGPNWHKVLSS